MEPSTLKNGARLDQQDATRRVIKKMEAEMIADTPSRLPRAADACTSPDAGCASFLCQTRSIIAMAGSAAPAIDDTATAMNKVPRRRLAAA
jgi:hypothetical protein